MTNETKSNFNNHRPLTVEALSTLQDKGYKYLQVKGFTLDHHPEYVEPHYIMLVPVRSLSGNRSKMDIYEDIDSSIFKTWANMQRTNENLEILIANVN